MERVRGIGGFFFRATDPQALARWYEANLGICVYPATDEFWMQEGGPTVLAPFAADTDYFGRADQQTMVNFRVRDLDATLAQLRDGGAAVSDEIHEFGYGRFGWATDPEGNRFELWQPSATVDVEQVVRRYLAVFVSGDLAELAALVAPDVLIHGAGTHVQGRHHVERAVHQAGLTCTDLDIHELFATGDRVVVYSTQRLRHDATGTVATLSGHKMYRLAGGRIVEFWGETDLYGLMRQLGRVPAEIVF